MDVNLLTIEALASTTGVLNPDLTPQKVEQAFKLPERLTRRLAKWIRNPQVRPFTLPKQLDPESTFERLGRTFEQDAQDAIGGPQDNVEWELKINQLRSLLTQLYPVTFARETLADIPLPNSEDEVQDFLATVSVVDSDTRLIEEIEMGTLTPELVDVYRRSFPEMYGLLKDTAHEQMIDLGASGKELGDHAEAVLMVLLDQRSPAEIKPPPAQPIPPATVKVDLSAISEKTNAQRAADK